VDPDTTLRDEGTYEPRAQDVARRLREAIFDGRLAAGQPIRQEAVAEDFGVSRIPVREALRELEAEGLVVIRPHSGARVARLDYVECEEIYKMRERLEPLALAESIAGIGDEQVATAIELAARMEGLRDPKARLAADRDLHLALYAGAAMPRLLQLVTGLWSAAQRYRRVLVQLADEEHDALQDSEHRLLLDALANRSARTGERLLRAHIERSRLHLARNRALFD